MEGGLRGGSTRIDLDSWRGVSAFQQKRDERICVPRRAVASFRVDT